MQAYIKKNSIGYRLIDVLFFISSVWQKILYFVNTEVVFILYFQNTFWSVYLQNIL